MKLWKILVPLALCLALALLILPGKANAATMDSGTCGDNLTWTLDDAGTLTISGTGPMKDYDVNNPAPWRYYGTESVSRLVVEEGVTSVGEMAFWATYAIKTVSLPSTLTTIGYKGFYSCGLETVTIPAAVTEIGQDAFYACSSLTRIWVAEENQHFSSDSYGVLFNKDMTTLIQMPCGFVGGYNVPQTVTTIAQHAFQNCGFLEDIMISASVTEIGKDALDGCNMDSIVVHANNTKYSSDGKVLFNKEKTELIVCPCKSLGEYVIPETVTVIRETAFLYSGVTAVHIPAAMTTICSRAFQHANLTDVYYDGTQEEWERIDISGGNDELFSATLHFANKIVPGELDGDGETTTNDAVYLLLSVMFGTEDYPVPGGVSLDFDGSGEVDTDDAVYLLLSVMFGEEDYPLYPNSGSGNGGDAPSGPDNDNVMTYQEFMAAEIGTTVCVETYVQATQEWWDETINVYARSEDGAYYLYYLSCSEEDAARLVPGTKIRVTGEKTEWAGEIEISYGFFDFLEGVPCFFEGIDATEMTETELKANMNKLAEFNGLTVEKIEYKNGEPGDDIYLTLNNGSFSINFQVEIYLTDTDSLVYRTVRELAVGDVVNVRGFLYWYEGPNPHITYIGKVTD